MYIKTKNRPCKSCGEHPRLPGLSICWHCDMLKKAMKFIANRRKQNALKEKEMKHRVKNTRQAVKKRVEKKFRLWFRMNSADKYGMVKCYTCGTKHHYKEVHAGHFRHNKLDFDIRNYKIQCIQCNNFLNGNLGVYKENLIRDYGIDYVKQLDNDADNYKIESVEEMLEIEKDIDKKIKILKSIL